MAHFVPFYIFWWKILIAVLRETPEKIGEGVFVLYVGKNFVIGVLYLRMELLWNNSRISEFLSAIFLDFLSRLL